MLTCYRCGKQIKGKVVHHVPSILAIRLGVDSQKAFHPVCYVQAEAEAAIELRSEEEA